jgi:hypothetical protein
MITLQLAQSEKGAAKGLCFEFILHEYAKALTMADKLMSAPPFDALAILEKLFHDSLNEDIQHRTGIIDKLCFYCEALVQTSRIGKHLLDAIDDLRNDISKPRANLARQLRSFPYCTSLSNHDFLHKLDQDLHAIFPLLADLLQTCLDCETALFALLELRKTLNHYLGEKTVETLLQQLFPGGPHLLRETLVNSYARRGFSDFFQRHEALFEGLVWPHSDKTSDLPR